MSSEPAVRVTDLHKHYGSRRAVDGVSFDVVPGQVFALLGPNGAGKSTTVEVLEGYRARTAGEVSVLGADPGRPTPAWRSRLGIVAQSTRDLSDLTVTEVVRQFATFYPHPRRPEAVVEQVGLADDARTRASALSGGRRRRLDVALGIVGDPELLFLDEPTTGFDPEARREFWALVQLLAADGTTILLTTHYLDEAAELAERAAIIVGGQMASVGRIDELGGPDARVPLVRWREGGVTREERTDDPGAFVSALYARGGEPERLEVVRPSLEDVYLSFLGDEARRSTAGDLA